MRQILIEKFEMDTLVKMLFFSLQNSGMEPHLNCTNIYAEVLIPWIKFGSNMKADLEMLSLLGFSTTGALQAVGSSYLILSQFHFQFYE